MERLPVLLLACCAAHRARAEGGVRVADLDWFGWDSCAHEVNRGLKLELIVLYGGLTVPI